MENVELFQAFIGWFRDYNAEVMHVLLEASPDIRLRLQLDGGVDTHVLDDLKRLLSVIFHVLFGHVSWTFVLRLVWLVKLLVLLDVLNELDGIQHAPARKFVESPLTCVEDELFLLDRQLLPGVSHDA